MSSMGIKINEFQVNVCNSFQAKILNNQLCYETDLNHYSNKDNLDRELELGFYFIMDYNEDRQVTFDKILNKTQELSMAANILDSDRNQHAIIYLDTIGN